MCSPWMFLRFEASLFETHVFVQQLYVKKVRCIDFPVVYVEFDLRVKSLL